MWNTQVLYRVPRAEGGFHPVVDFSHEACMHLREEIGVLNAHVEDLMPWFPLLVIAFISS